MLPQWYWLRLVQKHAIGKWNFAHFCSERLGVILEYEFRISGPLFEWRGLAPFHFVQIPSDQSSLIKSEASLLSYGWGVIPIHGQVGKTNFTTSLIPKDGNYLIPIKDAVRKSERLEIDDEVKISFNLGKSNN
jgi:hypothetical protein